MRALKGKHTEGMNTRLLYLIFGALMLSGEAAAQWNPQPNWEDSYAVGGRCYCNSNFDHGLRNRSAETPIGELNVERICSDIRNTLGEGPQAGRIPFNDIQCGNGPANTAADETGCPGRVDIGSRGCNVTGPRWDLQAVYGNNVTARNTSNGTCTATGNTLGQARTNFATSCPNRTRRDCDPVAGGWACSTANITASTPVVITPGMPSNPPAEPPVTPGNGNSCVSPLRSSLGAAISAYNNSCPNIQRRDCDRLSSGLWQCSSGVIGGQAPGGGSAPSTPPPSNPDPSNPAPVPPTPPTHGGACVSDVSASLGAARESYSQNCPSVPRRDCDPVGNGQWLCSSERIDGNNPPPANPPTVPPVTDGNGNIGRIRAGDLVALHYDNCPDRDDGHAIAAGKAVIEQAGITDFIIVNGTCGAGIRNQYQRSSVDVMRATWGTNWLDGFDQQTASVNASANRWAATISNGGTVWVAEGGPSDFTANVLRRLGSVFPSVDRRRVSVVQHSSGNAFNERETSRAGIQLVRDAATYITIPNGNVGGNGNADFNQLSSFFQQRARQSRYAAEWNAAFRYFNPNIRLDFSDTVELMYIIDDRTTLTVDQFARRYLNN